MKKLISIAVVILVFVCAFSAQTPTPVAADQKTVVTSPAGQPSAQELQAAKEILLKAVGDQKADTGKDSHKTMADVLDKGLDNMTSFVTTLEGLVSKYAPDVWRIMILQQYAKALAYPLFYILMFALLYGFQKVMRKYCGVEKDQAVFIPTKEEKISSYEISGKYWARLWLVGVIPSTGYLLLSVLFSFAILNTTMLLINPEYGAIRDIVGFIK